MKNKIAVAVGVRFRLFECEPGTVLKSGEDFYMKTSIPKYPLINLVDGGTVHYSAAEKMDFSLLNVGSRLTIQIAQKPKLRFRNRYRYEKRLIQETS